ncbi:hypothetical protein BRSPCE3_43620 [Bradyrhizobium sp. Ce-3]|nr:hypothetical protein BRSPCE3_43620 [Bradyrhizobium sp. Ce-3]
MVAVTLRNSSKRRSALWKSVRRSTIVARKRKRAPFWRQPYVPRAGYGSAPPSRRCRRDRRHARVRRVIARHEFVQCRRSDDNRSLDREQLTGCRAGLTKLERDKSVVKAPVCEDLFDLMPQTEIPARVEGLACPISRGNRPVRVSDVGLKRYMLAMAGSKHRLRSDRSADGSTDLGSVRTRRPRRLRRRVGEACVVRQPLTGWSPMGQRHRYRRRVARPSRPPGRPGSAG